jgi:septal ring-binding cell division protein DamX
MAREFAAAPSGKFTVQFEIVCDPSNITKALHTGGTNVWFLPISLKGRSCYRVFWGHYPTRDAAERGIREIPASLREAKPAVVSVPQS